MYLHWVMYICVYCFSLGVYIYIYLHTNFAVAHLRFFLSLKPPQYLQFKMPLCCGCAEAIHDSVSAMNTAIDVA